MIKSVLNNALDHPNQTALVAAILMLGSAYLFGFLGYHPCDLCWLQRYPYMAIIALTIIAGSVGFGNNKLVLGLCALGFFTTSGLGFYHMGVEQKWWQSFMQCSGAFDSNLSTAELLEAIKDTPLVRCDEIAWSFLGLSMAAWNGVIALVLGLFMLYAMTHASKTPAKRTAP